VSEEALAHWGLLRQKKKYGICIDSFLSCVFCQVYLKPVLTAFLYNFFFISPQISYFLLTAHNSVEHNSCCPICIIIINAVLLGITCFPLLPALPGCSISCVCRNFNIALFLPKSPPVNSASYFSHPFPRRPPYFHPLQLSKLSQLTCHHIYVQTSIFVILCTYRWPLSFG